MKFIDPKNKEGVSGHSGLWIKECSIKDGESMGDGAEWHSHVYRPKHKDANFDKNKWVILMGKVFRRDDYTCKYCKSLVDLSVHHIIPRADGGKDTMKNLETLCEKCHNLIEIVELPVIDDRPIGKNWHEWVYGGMRGPNYKF